MTGGSAASSLIGLIGLIVHLSATSRLSIVARRTINYNKKGPLHLNHRLGLVH